MVKFLAELTLGPNINFLIEKVMRLRKVWMQVVRKKPKKLSFPGVRKAMNHISAAMPIYVKLPKSFTIYGFQKAIAINFF